MRIRLSLTATNLDVLALIRRLRKKRIAHWTSISQRKCSAAQWGLARVSRARFGGRPITRAGVPRAPTPRGASSGVGGGEIACRTGDALRTCPPALEK